MKQSALLVFGLLLFFSCTKNNDFEKLDSQFAAESLDSRIEFEHLSPTLNDSQDQMQLDLAEDPFEIDLQWASYITAIVLWFHPEFRSEFIEIMVNPSQSIRLNELVYSSVSPGSSSFNDLFWNYANSYYYPGRPNGDRELPGLAPEPTNGLFGQEVIDLIDRITEEHCVELYFPVGLNTVDIEIVSITSTAHPLRDISYNYGFNHHESESGSSMIDINKERFVNAMYVSNHENVIVARPYRNRFSCTYTEYDIPDFTLFLKP